MPRQRCSGCGEPFLDRVELGRHQDMEGCSKSLASESPHTGSITFTLRDGRVAEMTGTVCEYHPARAFGYVRTTDLHGHIQEETRSVIDVFFHSVDVTGPRVSERDQVRFDVIDGGQGLRCVDVEITMQAEESDGTDAPQIP